MFMHCVNLTVLDFVFSVTGSSASSMFYDCQSLTSCRIQGMSQALDASNMFATCSYLQIAPSMLNVKISNASGMFKYCQSLLETPNIGNCFNGCTNFSDAFNGCSSLRHINYVDTAAATNVSSMFKYCQNVESGANTLYQQMSTQATPPASYSNCFTDCGSNTPSGAADLAQIPASWGGSGS
jgi:hypothetical protein